MVLPFLNRKHRKKGRFQKEGDDFLFRPIEFEVLMVHASGKAVGITCVTIFTICRCAHAHTYTSGVSERAPGKREKVRMKMSYSLGVYTDAQGNFMCWKGRE